MSRKTVALRDFTVFVPAVAPATKETRVDYRAGEPIDVAPETDRDWRGRGLAGDPPSDHVKKETTEE